MSRVSRRSVLRALGIAGGAALAGCSGDAESGDATTTPTATETAAPTPTTTATATATPAPKSALAGGDPLGAESMLGATPMPPGMSAETFLWARHVDAGALLADVEDETVAGRLRDGWLGSGPPRYTDSDAFEVVHVQPRGLPNLTLGRGGFDPAATVEGLRADGWTRAGTERGYARFEYGGYTMAVADTHWFVVQKTDPAWLRSLIDADPLAAHLGDVDGEALARATAEEGHYHVLERSVGDEGFAAGIAVNHAPYRNPVGVMQYATGRTSPTWERIEHRFRQQVVGEVRSSDFGDDGR